MKQYPSSQAFKGQQQTYPAQQSKMDPLPDVSFSEYKPAGKLKDQVALITGGDSGIGRAVAIAYCMEGANVAIFYNENDGDALETKTLCEKWGTTCLVLKGDVRQKKQCIKAVTDTV
ncbi:MAG: SDR family NAD(P)-dependent oxidoreductase, partial [Sphingobacteriaceae bacterium]